MSPIKSDVRPLLLSPNGLLRSEHRQSTLRSFLA